MIRPMTAGDIGHVQQIARITWNDTYQGIIPEDIQLDFLTRTYSDAMLRKRMEKTCVLIAEYEGVPIGFLNYTKEDEDGDSELTAMYILPTYQQAGFGKRLMEYALHSLRTAKQLFVYVDGRNEMARAFYERQGFQLLEEFEEYFEGYPVETAQYVYYIHEPVLV
ncbi:GNAT family N-acetyltransferase [Sporosarcina sp. Te-1]|uniref:GNAT family N-acetyltransferase n=1 Tax=Sporosarcina sp. Te-1 TaxID=2818390 RepID=UPI001A9ECCAE|nr:GNAT family N-acetyltransferase [Sporosarcina sp. Te-1]QTD39605.1 GNAT family N-acetyltransferase [Sporosarcina sp. Te-1]